MSSPSTFPLFPLLPPELRTHIYHLSLPSPPPPLLIPFRPGLWTVTPCPPRRLFRILSFSTTSLSLRLPVPALAFVSPECHAFYLSLHDPSQHIFRPELDILYVPPNSWPTFVSLELRFDPALSRGVSFRSEAGVKRVTTGARTLGMIYEHWDLLWWYWPAITRVDVLIGQEILGEGVWGVRELGVKWVWKGEERGLEVEGDPAQVEGLTVSLQGWRSEVGRRQPLLERMEVVKEQLARGLVERGLEGFEIVIVEAQEWKG